MVSQPDKSLKEILWDLATQGSEYSLMGRNEVVKPALERVMHFEGETAHNHRILRYFAAYRPNAV
jgi:hypothetical protein